jgi:hypothetical protein
MDIFGMTILAIGFLTASYFALLILDKQSQKKSR